MKKYFEILRKCPLFDKIKDENFAAMLECMESKIMSFAKKEIVMAEGDEAKYIGIVLSGNVRIERIDYYGNRSIIAIAEPSELFGESFACAGSHKMPIDVVAATDAEVMFIDCKKLISRCSNDCDCHNQMIYNLLKIVATKNIMLNQKAEITGKKTTREKLMTFLHLQAKKAGSDTFTISYDRQALADFLGVDRSGLSAEISKLRNEGIIECRKNKFKLCKEE